MVPKFKVNIHPLAIKRFMAQPRNSHVWMKQLKHSELNQALDEIGFEQNPNVRRLLKPQKVCIILGLRYGKFAFWLDMGVGKSRVALELIKFLIDIGEIKSALIQAFSELAIIAWENEIKEWQIDLPVVTLLNSSSQDKWDELAEFEGGIILATYAGLTRMCCVPGKNSKGKGILKLKYSLVRKLVKIAGIGCVVPDESTLLGNKGSLQYRIANQMDKYINYLFELAGRPFGKDPEMLWSQCYLLDRGLSLGDTLGLFRAGFYKTKINFWGGYKHTFIESKKKILNKFIRHRSIQYRYEECGKLPKIVPILEEVVLPDEATVYYKRFLKQLQKSHAGFEERKNTFIRMRQISSGFIGIKNDDTGAKAEIAFADNPKLERMIELIKQVDKDRKFVIFHEFTYSGKMICEALKKLKIKHDWVRGGTKDVRGVQDRFDHDDNYRGLVVNHKLGAFSLNLQRANYLFFYESPLGTIEREQAERRLRRRGQKKTVFMYDMVCRGTNDARIIHGHKTGENFFKAVMRDPSVI